MVSGSGSRDINKGLCRISVEMLVCLILGCHNYTSHYAAAAYCFAVRFINLSSSLLPESSEFFEAENLHKSLPQSNCAGDYFRANFNLFSCCWLFSVHYELSDSDWSQEQLSRRRLEEILSRVIIKPRICTSNASSSLFRPVLISIDQMDLVTRDCFKQQPSEDWL